MEQHLGNADNLHIILVRPQLAENIGMAIRGMVNCGISNLRIVSPRCGWPNKQVDLASAETLKYVNVELFDSTETALADLHYIMATTARERNMINTIYSPASAANLLHDVDGYVGVMFGSEQSGLKNEDIVLCNGIISIPSIGFRSYNLAQAVLIICYTFAGMLEHKYSAMHLGKTNVATHAEVNSFLKTLENALVERGYFSNIEAKQGIMMQTLRNFFMKSAATKQEINSLFGAIRHLWQR